MTTKQLLGSMLIILLCIYLAVYFTLSFLSYIKTWSKCTLLKVLSVLKILNVLFVNKRDCTALYDIAQFTSTETLKATFRIAYACVQTCPISFASRGKRKRSRRRPFVQPRFQGTLSLTTSSSRGKWSRREWTLGTRLSSAKVTSLISRLRATLFDH